MYPSEVDRLDWSRDMGINFGIRGHESVSRSQCPS